MSDLGTSEMGPPAQMSPESPATTGASSPSAATVERRMAASIEQWKRKLLDLSKRNRALHFKMSKVSTIAIVDEQPAEVFRQLCMKHQGMRFKAAPEPKGPATAAAEDHAQMDTLAEGDRVRPLLDLSEPAATPIDDEDGEIP